ncbi:hypothetical protein RYX36_026011 [Vicia faba]
MERLEVVKTELQIQISVEEKVNAKLQSYVKTRKEALQERSLVLERDVNKLQEQLLKEKNFRGTLEAGPKFLPGTLSELIGIDEQTKTDFEELVTIEAELLLPIQLIVRCTKPCPDQNVTIRPTPV